MKRIEVHLCKGCIEDLKEYDPYIIPVTIKEVPQNECDNFNVDEWNERITSRMEVKDE